MRKTIFRTLALMLVVLAVFTGCGKEEKAPEPVKETVKVESSAAEKAPAVQSEAPAETEKAAGDDIVTFEGNYTYNEAVSQMPTNWSPHTYQTSDDSYPQQFITSGFYSFIFNDELNPLEGKDPYEGYVIVPEMAADLPVDVTEQVKAEHPEFGIPASATSGFAYTIDLNENAVWENGKKITADTYVESMKRLLDPKLLNYRASDYYMQSLAIAGAEFYANQGQTKVIPVGQAMKNEGIGTLREFFDMYGDTKTGYINWAYSFGAEYDFRNASKDDIDLDAFIPSKDETQKTPYTLSELAQFYIDVNELLQDVGAEVSASWIPDELYVEWTYPSDVSYDTVGVYKSGEYQITIVLTKALAGFQLLYNLGSSWLVEPELYDACLKETNGVWTSTYNTSVETTLSYGPYRLVSYQPDKAMRFEKNDSWYGWTDGKHVYVDPMDGNTYQMYQTTAIDTQKIEEASTQKLMFLKGQLMTYGLQSEDFAQYRNSDFCHVTPDLTVFFLILNGHEQALENREASKDFDQTTTDLETMLLDNFRKAVALTYDKELFAATVSPQRSGGYGIIGTSYIYDPETGARYRDTDQAKQVLCDFYSVDVDAFASLDDAVASITGYDPEKAREYYTLAFADALEAGYITDIDGDGISDQTVTIEYCLSNDSSFMTKTVDYLNEKMDEVTKGTPFEKKVRFVKSAPYGNEWTDKIKGGMSDTVLAGWTGSMLNPFGLTDLYTNPDKQYDAAWFDSSSVKMTVNVPIDGVGTDVTMSLRKWSDSLNGETVTQDGIEYNFGEGQADIETRLDILAAIEGEVLRTYNYIPMLQNAGMHLLSQKAYYVVDEYNPIMGTGGIQYLKYNYTDEEWKDYVKEQGGELKY